MIKAKGSFLFDFKMLRLLVEAFLAKTTRQRVRSCDCMDQVSSSHGRQMKSQSILTIAANAVRTGTFDDGTIGLGYVRPCLKKKEKEKGKKKKEEEKEEEEEKKKREKGKKEEEKEEEERRRKEERRRRRKEKKEGEKEKEKEEEIIKN
ncbi:hypothetical protein STEG23_010701 [Scotinomys teguina]